MNLYEVKKDFKDGRRMRLLVTAMNIEHVIEIIENNPTVKKDLSEYNSNIENKHIILIGEYSKNTSKILQCKNEKEFYKDDTPKLVPRETAIMRRWISVIFCNLFYLLLLCLVSNNPLSPSSFKDSLPYFLAMILPVTFIAIVMVEILIENENDEIKREYY